MLGYAMNPPPGNGLVAFQVRTLFDTGLIMLGEMILLGNGVLLPGKVIARVTAGLLSLGYQRFPGCTISEKSPSRMARGGRMLRVRFSRHWRRTSEVNVREIWSLSSAL